MKNWKTTLGGALSALGTSLAGCATVGALTMPEYKTIALWLIVGGALLSALGKFFGMLFAADAVPTDKGEAGKILPMIALLLSLGLGLGAIGAISTGCTTNQQKIAYNTLYSVEKTTTAAYDSYIDTVIKGISTKDGVPRVSKAYNTFQASFLLALDAAQYNTNALAPAALMVESMDVINLINQVKGK